MKDIESADTVRRFALQESGANQEVWIIRRSQVRLKELNL